MTSMFFTLILDASCFGCCTESYSDRHVQNSLNTIVQWDCMQRGFVERNIIAPIDYDKWKKILLQIGVGIRTGIDNPYPHRMYDVLREAESFFKYGVPYSDLCFIMQEIIPLSCETMHQTVVSVENFFTSIPKIKFDGIAVRRLFFYVRNLNSEKRESLLSESSVFINRYLSLICENGNKSMDFSDAKLSKDDLQELFGTDKPTVKIVFPGLNSYSTTAIVGAIGTISFDDRKSILEKVHAKLDGGYVPNEGIDQLILRTLEAVKRSV